MEKNQPITIMIHDLNPWGGQDRSMLEIAWELNQEFPLKIHSFSLEGYQNWPDMEHIQYVAKIKKPILIKYLNYHFNSWRQLRNGNNPFIQSTGTASLRSDVVQVQFIHHTWTKIAEGLPPDKIHSQQILKGVYHSFLKHYKLGLEKRIYQPQKKYIAISHAIKKELMEHFSIPSENIEIIYHGVNPKDFFPIGDDEENKNQRKKVRDQLGLKDSDFALLHVGALNARKGLFKSLEVVSYLKQQGFDKVKLLAVGQGDQEILKNTSKELDIEDRLILAPHSKQIRDYYWAADCFFFPTYYEPFGLVILEAMACGLPVVVSDCAGGSELIEEGYNGFLINPWDKPKDIANGLLPLLRTPELGKQIGLQASRTAENHTWKKVGKQYRQFYKKLSSQT